MGNLGRTYDTSEWAMNLPEQPSGSTRGGMTAVTLLDALLQPESLLGLRDQAMRNLALHPRSTTWHDALLALDRALQELTTARARAGLAPHAGNPLVVDLTYPERHPAAAAIAPSS